MFLRLEKLQIKNDDDRIASYLLKAHLSSLLDGITYNHIPRASGVLLRKKLGSELKRLGYLNRRLLRTGIPLGGEATWNAFASAVRRAGEQLYRPIGAPHKLADRRNPNSAYASTPLVNVGALNWLDHFVRLGARAAGHDDLETVRAYEVEDKALDRVWLSRCVHCVATALASGLIRTRDYLKGSSAALVWLSPLTEQIAVVARTKAAGDLPQSATDELRDLLGLWAENGIDLRPLVLFELNPSVKLYAPNVLTASCYARFRHRPKRLLSSAPEAGLTYNLDRASPSAGASEVVAVGVPWGAVVDVTSCGLPSRLALSSRELVAAHRKYAQDVSRRRTWRAILESLEALT